MSLKNISEEDWNKLQQDVTEIKVALIGSELSPSGLIDRVKIVESDLDIIKNKRMVKLENRNYIAYGIITVVIMIVGFWDKISNFFK